MTARERAAELHKFYRRKKVNPAEELKYLDVDELKEAFAWGEAFVKSQSYAQAKMKELI